MREQLEQAQALIQNALEMFIIPMGAPPEAVGPLQQAVGLIQQALDSPQARGQAAPSTAPYLPPQPQAPPQATMPGMVAPSSAGVEREALAASVYVTGQALQTPVTAEQAFELAENFLEELAYQRGEQQRPPKQNYSSSSQRPQPGRRTR